MSDRTRERPFSAVAQLLRRDDLFASAGAGEALAAFVARQSLACFGQRPAGGLNANVLDTGNAAAQPQASMARNGDRWRFKLTFDASAGFSCTDVS